jgi:hypothetical protein
MLKAAEKAFCDCESSVHAADLIEDIAHREKINKNQLVIHSDNGSPMKGATLRAKMIVLKSVHRTAEPVSATITLIRSPYLKRSNTITP